MSAALPGLRLTGVRASSERAARLNGRTPRRRAGPPPQALVRSQQAASGEQDEPSTSGRSHLEAWLPSAAPAGAGAAAAAVAAAAAFFLSPEAAHASGGGEADPHLLEFVIEFIEGLGPWGPAAFVATVALAECIPLFPTQPLSLASGLLFGAQKGALCMLSGTVLAALLAFQIARGIGRPLAERIINHELSSSDSEGASAGEAAANPVQRKLAEVNEAIERGSFWQQAGAVLLLRLTPVVPFSASNYVLGLSPLKLPPYLAGTAAGMAFWSVFYASLGGASRSLLRRGVDADLLMADMMEKAGLYTRELAILGALLGGGALLYFGNGFVQRRIADAQAAEDAEQGGTGAAGKSASAATAAQQASSNGSGMQASSNGSNGDGASKQAGGNGSGASGTAAAGPRVRLGAEAQQLGRELTRELGSSGAAVGKELELAGKRLKGWLSSTGPPPAARSKELIESRAKE